MILPRILKLMPTSVTFYVKLSITAMRPVLFMCLIMFEFKNITKGICLVLLMLVMGNGFQPAHAETDQEYTLRAALASNFARFTTWPQGAVDAMGPNMTLCLVGNPVLEEAFAGLNGKTVGDKVLQVRYLSRFNNLAECQILYISDLEKSKLLVLLNEIKALPILTIGEDAAFTKQGGMVSIQILDDKPNIMINLKASKSSNLNIRARVLKIATVIQ